MHIRRIIAGVAVTVTVGAALTTTSPALAAQKWDTGTLTVVIHTPDGVPAHVVLTGRDTDRTVFAGKGPRGTWAVQKQQVPADRYAITLPDLQWHGTHYLAWAKHKKESVRPGHETVVNVVVTPDGGARNLQVTDRKSNSLSLKWQGPEQGYGQPDRKTVNQPGDQQDGRPGDQQGNQITYTLVRFEGSNGSAGAAKVRDGVVVPLKDGSTWVTDTGLKPDTYYTYALLTKGKRLKAGPVVVCATTLASRTPNPDPTWTNKPTPETSRTR